MGKGPEKQSTLLFISAEMCLIIATWPTEA